MTNDPAPAPSPENRRLVLVADPGLPSEIAKDLAQDLPECLQRRLGAGIRWQVDAITAPLVADEQVDLSDMAEAVGTHLEDQNWDIGIFLTDLPRRAQLHPVSAEINTDRHMALISLPALGSRNLHSRVEQAVLGIVSQLTPHGRTAQPHVLGRPARETSPDVAPGPAAKRYVVPGLRGHARMIAGMVRANRPWRLFTSLSRALAGVFATAAVLFFNSATWDVAPALTAWQQALVTALSALALTSWIIIDHHLWEREGDQLPGRHNALYPYNLVTLITIALGVLSLYAVLLATLVALSFLVLDPAVFGKTIGRATHTGDYLYLAWFITSLSLVGGAFGTGLEESTAVRNAAYGQRHRERQQQLEEAQGKDENSH
ncbi:hypothetical protein ACFYPC_27430 [Streptomyces sp. NPDC005808]|uniref:hypothetical protein n=1 Tax=Streptomyces sp. NPDC005808 TaxID=3364734 RepID=UPI00368A196E